MDILKLLTKGSTSIPPEVPVDSLRKAVSSPQEEDLLKAKGITTDILTKLMSENMILNSDRTAVYRQLESSLCHPLVSSAISLFADSACNKSAIFNKSIWVDTENKEYKYQIEKMFDIINIDEVLYDWAWTCLRGDTKISLLDGTTPTIKEMADNPTKYISKKLWSINPETKQLEIDYIARVFKTKQNAELIRVHLDNKRHVDCTPDHKFMMRNGSFKTAEDLKEGDSLMPLYSKPFRGYGKFYNPKDDKWYAGCELVLTYDFLVENYVNKKLTSTDKVIKEAKAEYLNHKVLSVEKLTDKEDVYDITTVKNHNFPTEAGVFVHNCGLYGDLFVEVFGGPGLGITSVADDLHPISISRADHCLSGNTKISLLNGTTPTIKEIADNPSQYIGKYVLSINPDTKALEPDKIVAAKKTRLNAELIRVWLDNGKYVDCTPDHRFMLRDGSYKEAKDLEPGQSLMPLYTRKAVSGGLKGYQLVYNPGKNKWQFTHRLVSDCINGKIKKGFVIHHKDINRLNNDPTNFQVMLKEDHLDLHHSRLKQLWENPEFRKKAEEGCRNHPEGCQCASCLSRQGNRPAHKDGCDCIICQPILAERETRVCACGCGQTFECKISSKQRYIKACSNRLNGRKLVLNHKVLRVERLTEREDTYDIQTEKNHNFCLNVGIFVHNCGRLIGFFETPQGVTSESRRLLPPWQYVHFRLLGAKKRRPLYADANYTEFRSISLMAPDIRRVNSKYGVSLANDALPIYRRLRLAEDSILMSRITKGVLRYIYKVGVGENTNASAVQALIDNYVDVLKQARNLSLDTNDPRWNAKSSQLAANEDIILPVWGDVNNLQVEKIGGEVDIRWVVDVDELRNQLSCALKCPLSMLGGYQKETTGPLGGNAAERIDIRFARQVRRLQSTLVNGITRLAQIHLAYQGMSPDLNLFKIRMAEVSTAEELEAQKGLSEAADTVDKVTELIFKHTGETIDKVELLNYFNQKFLKLDDLDLKQMIKDAKRVGPHTSIEPPKEDGKEGEKPSNGGEPNPFRESKIVLVENSDLKSPLPVDIVEEAEKVARTNKIWESEYRGMMVQIEESKV